MKTLVAEKNPMRSKRCTKKPMLQWNLKKHNMLWLKSLLLMQRPKGQLVAKALTNKWIQEWKKIKQKCVKMLQRNDFKNVDWKAKKLCLMLLLIRGPNIKKRKVGDDKMYYTDIDWFFLNTIVFWLALNQRKFVAKSFVYRLTSMTWIRTDVIAP